MRRITEFKGCRSEESFDAEIQRFITRNLPDHAIGAAAAPAGAPLTVSCAKIRTLPLTISELSIPGGAPFGIRLRERRAGVSRAQEKNRAVEKGEMQ